jgi:hypothetical protein
LRDDIKAVPELILFVLILLILAVSVDILSTNIEPVDIVLTKSLSYVPVLAVIVDVLITLASTNKKK